VQSAGGGVARAAEPSPLAAAQQVLDTRAAAIRTGDRTGFMATVDPQAPAAFLGGQARSFDGWRTVPLASYQLQVRTEDSGDLATGLSSRYGGAPVYLPETRQRYRLADYDDRDAVDSLWLTFVQRSGRWYVGGDTDVEELGLQTARMIWELGPVLVTRTRHFLVLAHPAQAARASALASIAEEAADNLDRLWDEPWSHRIPLVLPGSVDELGVLLQSTVDLDKFVAFVLYGQLRDDGWEPTAPRIFIQDRQLGRFDHTFQVQTLTHELSHGAASGLAGPLIPVWVHEGLADWVASARALSEQRPPGSSPEAPRDYEFSTGAQGAIVRAYREARTLVVELARTKGTSAPTALFAALGALRVAPGNPDHQVDATLRRLDGLGLADLERRWASG